MSFTYNINLGLLGTKALDGVISQLDRMERKLGLINDRATHTGNRVNAGFANMGRTIGGFESRLNSSTGAMNNLGNSARNTESSVKSSFSNMSGSAAGLVAQIGLVAGAWTSLQSTAKLDSAERAIKFASGSNGDQNLAFIKSEVDRLNVDKMGALQGFKTLQGSLMGTGLEGVGTQLFSGMGEASAALGLDPHQFELSLKAFGQMASKGVVNSEELKLQLGDHLPGALGIAARAMGVTTGELMKMMEKGELLAVDFLPKMAAELRNTFSSQASANAQSATAQFAIFSNTMLDLKEIVGRELLPIFNSFLKDALIPGVKWLGENKGVLYGVATALGVATGAQLLMNLAMIANPIGATIVALGVLAKIFYEAYQKSEKFRSTTHGIWEVLKNLGSVIWRQAIAPLETLSKMLIGVLSGDLALIKEGIMTIPNAYKQSMKEIMDMPDAYNRGKNRFVGPSIGATGDYDPLGVNKWIPKQKNGGLPPFLAPTSSSPTPTDPLGLNKGIKDINEGGRTSKVINISLDNIVQTLEINAANVTEGMDDMVEMVTRKLTQIINNANQVQTQF